MLLNLSYGKTIIPIELSLEHRKSLTITVYPDKKVVARAPIEKHKDEIIKRLKKHCSWIIRKLDYFEQFHPLPPKQRYLSGESFYYLGRQYRLKIIKGERPSIKLKGKFYWITVPDTSNTKMIKTVFMNWYASHAKVLFLKRLEYYHEKIIKNNPLPPLRIKWFKSKWGSYSPKQKVIRLNIELVKAPIHCIDYVIIHELCHIIHPHHNKAYYKLLTKGLPDWKDRKYRLERVII